MKFYGQGKIDVYLHDKLFKNKQGGFFVECGAFDGRIESTCLVFEESMGWTGVNIEPVPHAFNQLTKNRPSCINLKYALSDTDRSEVFLNAIHPKVGRRFGNGSLKHCKEHMKDLVKQGCTFEKFNVQCKRFDNIVEEYGIPDIDLFVLDVEGHEMQALKGIIPKVLPRVFCIEHTFAGLNNLKEKLKKYYKLRNVHQHNAIFVRI